MSRCFYITTPIYYVNGDPHIGHTYTTVLADTLTRYRKLCGERAFLLSGSDEHGEKILEVAEQRGVSAQEIANLYSEIFRKTWSDLGIGIDRFIRTTEPAHETVVRDILQRVYDAGHIEFREYEGLYCVGCERFLTDRDMKDGLCLDHERAPEQRTESNYFFKMSEHFEWLQGYIDAHPEFIRPTRYRNEALAMLKDESGLGDLCISRPKSRLDWGIELPFDADYVCYVWFDALISYLTGIGYPESDDFTDFWAEGEHLIGKDILKPHAIFWPCMLRSIGLAPVRHLNVHGFWNVDNRKVSKSLGNMISPRIMQERYGFDSFRYFLLRDMVFGLDSNFSEEAMIARLNADLANNLGNLVSRTLNMTAKFSGTRVPEPGEPEEPEREVAAAAAKAVASVDLHMRAMAPQRALEAIFQVVDTTNRYLEFREPWKAAKDPAREAGVSTTLYTCCEALRIVALLVSPFMPQKAPEILARLGIPQALSQAQLPDSAAWGGIPVGSTTTQGSPLFPRIDVDAVAQP